MLLLSTVRIGQISGGNPLNDTTRWGALGFDEGANTEHNGRLYFFPGDVVRPKSQTDPLNNSHLVAWTEDRTVTRADSGGGFHLQAALQGDSFWPFEASAPVGITLSLEPAVSAFSYGGRVYVFTGAGHPHWSGQVRPGDPAYGLYLVSTDQPDQTYAYRTEFLFNPRIGVCPADGGSHSVLGYNFVLAHDVLENRPHQGNWFRCRKCASLFHIENKRILFPSGPPLSAGLCQTGGAHEREERQTNYAMPHNRSEDALNQGKWRRCGKCQTMYWSGYSPALGICPADRPDIQGSWGHEPADQIHFVLSHDHPEDSLHVANWRRCKKCSSLFWDGLWIKGECAGVPPGPDGRPHDAIGDESGDPETALQNELILAHEVPEDATHQANWRFCTKCLGLFFNGNPPGQNICLAGGAHTGDPTQVPQLPNRIEPPVGYNFVLPQGWMPEDRSRQGSWHLCTKCALLFSDLYFDQWTVGAKAPLAAGDPAIILTEGQQHIFYRDADGAILHVFWNAGDNKLYHDNWTEPAGASAAAGEPATMVTGNQQHIFYRSKSGAIIHIFWGPGFAHPVAQDWTALAKAPAAAGDPATMVTDSQQHIFYRGTDGAIHHIFWTAGIDTFAHENWTALAGAPAAAGEPATMVTEGQQHVFYRGVEGAMNHIFWQAANHSFTSQDWTARAGARVAVGDPATMVVGSQQHIFYLGLYGVISHILWDSTYALTRCPAGDSHAPSGDEYVLPHRFRQDLQHDRHWRFCTKCFGLVSAVSDSRFFTVDTAVVNNASFEGLPSKSGEGLVILGYGFRDFFLAWMPLGLSGPRLQDTMYYASPDNAQAKIQAPGKQIGWDPSIEKAAGLFGAGGLSDENRISLAWLEGPQRWILLYTPPEVSDAQKGVVVARIGATLWDWSDEVQIISPQASPELYDMVKLHTWPYGPSLLKRFTEWDPNTRVLGIYYLISLSKEYQVHLMYTRLKLDRHISPVVVQRHH